MAENTPENGAAAAATPDPDKQPRFAIVNQFVKDLSFENPRAPESLQSEADKRPEIQVGVDSRAKSHGKDTYEVEIEIKTTAKAGENTTFMLELTYGGLFNIANVPEDKLQPLLFIECPRMLFPFARRIVADAIRDGGFPPLMIDPIDFAALYVRKVQAAKATAEARQAEGASPTVN